MAMSQHPRTPELLRKAADIIEREGHAKGELRDPQGRHCATGAVMAAERPGSYDIFEERLEALTSDVINAVKAVGRYLDPNPPVDVNEYTMMHWPMVVNWNNAPERTAEEVVDTLRTVANLHDIAVTPKLQPARVT